MTKPWEAIGNEWFNYENVYKRIIDSVPPAGTVVEVGCWKGSSTMFLNMLAKEKNISVFAVDTWLGSKEHSQIMEVKNKTIFGIFVENMKQLINDIHIIRLPSASASKAFEDNSLDAVFIDAEHLYESVKEDIECWLPKVRTGGILAGHDYSQFYQGVIRAVDELLPSREIVECRNRNKCWYYLK